MTCILHGYIDDEGQARCHSCFRSTGPPIGTAGLRLDGAAPEIKHPRAHVVMVFHGLHICGAARHCLEALAVLRSRDVYTTMLAPYGGGQWGDQFLESCHEVVLHTDPTDHAGELADIEWRTDRRIFSLHYDIAMDWALSHVGDQEVYAHFHTEPEFGDLTRATLARAGTSCRRITFPSTSTRSSYLGLLDVEPAWWREKATVLPNAIPTDFRVPGSWNRRPHAHPRNRLAIVSRLDRDKISVPVLVGALELTKEQIPDLRVRIAGNGTIGQEIEGELDRRGMLRYVELLGWVQEIETVYGWADATFLPSHSETMPYAAMESISARRAVAVPSLGYFAETAGKKDRLAVTYEPGDTDDAAAAIVQALQTSAEPTSERVSFDPRLWQQQVADLYVLEQKGSP